MIHGLSKAITLYLAPLLSLTALLLLLFTFLSPVVMLHNQVALISVVPSTALSSPESASDNADGPTIRMGVLGSCERPNKATPLNCTAPSLTPVYDFSDLPQGSPNNLLSAPTSATPPFIAVSLFFLFLFVTLFTMISFRAKMGARLSASLERPFINRAVAWVGLLGFMIGITAFLVLRMWFGKSADDFNSGLEELGAQAPHLIAEIGNGFTMVWVAYAFLAVPLVASLAKLHVTAGKA